MPEVLAKVTAGRTRAPLSSLDSNSAGVTLEFGHSFDQIQQRNRG